ncbi:MAG TPA: class I SAM-dependent methyltransferase [Streptosporangiaceae bacterium]
MADTADYRQIRNSLRASYEAGADRRDRLSKQPWKLAERAAFLARLQAAGCRRLLEIGAGTGQDGAFFAEHGLDVLATDLSPAMVARCREKGLDARVLDFAELGAGVSGLPHDGLEPACFDAVHAMNCLLHVPTAELPAILAAIERVLRPGGLFFLGLYGGAGTEGPAEWDDHVPKRFFSFRTDEQIVAIATERFSLLDFHVVGAGEQRFQSLTLFRPGAAGRPGPARRSG